MTAFRLVEPLAAAIVPRRNDGTLMTTYEATTASHTWRRFEELYTQHRGSGPRTPSTLTENLDFSGKLTRQLTPAGNGAQVMYNGSGQVLRAAAAARTPVESNLYRIVLRTFAEADYLAAMLNAGSLRTAFAESRESGWHFHTNPLRKVPVPKYDHGDADHRRIAAIGRRLRTKIDPKSAEGAALRVELSSLAAKLVPTHAYAERRHQTTGAAA